MDDLEAKLSVVRQYMREVKVPATHDKVFKEECMFTFDTPESDDGLLLNMSTFQAFSSQYVELDRKRTGQHIYLHEKWNRVPLPEEKQVAQESKPDKLAVGGQGGFQVDAPKYDIEKVYKLVVLPEGVAIPLPCPELPELVLQSITAIMAHDSASLQEKVAVWEEDRKVSKYAANLEQLEARRTIPSDPTQWKCDDTGVTENLWLNLSTGHIGSGRQHWDGSGGNGSALRHFEATGSRYPLVVKLGTITPNGADVYSYAPDEDDMVEDPHLAEHLAHWGINMMAMSKTEKTMTELQIDLNMSFEYDKITEAGSELKPLSGPGYVGLVNLGNSCYMNSVLQLLWTIPSLQARYVWEADRVFETAPAESQNDFLTQMAKVGVALTQGRTGQPTKTAFPSDRGKDGNLVSTSVRPQFFKTLVGRGHPEFSTGHQQDAMDYVQHLLSTSEVMMHVQDTVVYVQDLFEVMTRVQDAVEYVQYLFEVMTRAEHAAGTSGRPAGELPQTADAFKFEVEDRIQCQSSQAVKYKRSAMNVMGLSIPLDAATNQQELAQHKDRDMKRARVDPAEGTVGSTVANGTEGENGGIAPPKEKEAPVVPRVPFAACLAQWAAESSVADYYSAAIQGKTVATKRQRFATFPSYLLIQMRRYYVAADWTAKKLEVLVDVPEQLDLEHLRGTGLQPGEQEQPQDSERATAASTPAAVEPDAVIVSALTAMGFSENGAKRAALAVNNSGVEPATEWVFAHMEDPDFNDPPAAASGTVQGEDGAVDPESLALLTAMGFTERAATASLKVCGGNVERAGDWLFSHMDDLDNSVEQVLSGGALASAAAAGASTNAAAVDGKGLYELVGFASHMGANTACGHYVAHVKKEGRWVIFNDEKVAESTNPPKDLGFLYMFKRVESFEEPSADVAMEEAA